MGKNDDKPKVEQYDGDAREDEEVFDRIYAQVQATPADPVYPPTEYARKKLEAYYAAQAEKESHE